jgi:hypothetical protein
MASTIISEICLSVVPALRSKAKISGYMDKYKSRNSDSEGIKCFMFLLSTTQNYNEVSLLKVFTFLFPVESWLLLGTLSYR